VTPDHTTDVLIVGCGIMGAATAALLRERLPDVRLTLVDGGLPIGAEPGGHLHDTSDPQLWNRYNQRVSSGIQGLYAGDPQFELEAMGGGEPTPGLHRLRVYGHDDDQLPGAALAWNFGGMGVHWTAATPWPDGAERFGDPDRWEADLDLARRLLHVTPSPLGPTRPGELVLQTLRRLFGDGVRPERQAQPMPMAVEEVDGWFVRTGPARIFPHLATGGDGDGVRVLAGSLVSALLHDGEHVSGARVRDVATGEETVVAASQVVVCADAVRSPQLLFASGIRPPALGRFLDEHAFVSNRVLLDLERFGLELGDLPLPREGEFVTDSLWLPQTGPDQPYQAQIMCRTYQDDDASALGYGIGFSVYVPLPPRAENRLTFDENTSDVAGLPRIGVEFSYSESDRELIDGVEPFMRRIAAEFGDWDPATESRVLEPGASLHYTGTVRSGPVDDGTSVCDPSGRVWDFDNLFVAGNGVVPTALAANATLTGVVTVIRAAEAVVGNLRPAPAAPVGA
jgi:choline dehydrogenase-like flavoprotein